MDNDDQPIKYLTVSVFGCNVFDIHLWIGFIPNAVFLFVDVAIQPGALHPTKFVYGNGTRHFLFGLFDEFPPCLMIVLMTVKPGENKS
ncbi:hypothetical protein TNCV_931791 [Trichonephila clavipes]|uniref:Uncharacterized protein n=1 Tax=Trichonephila clavipes TaxID=2585209 RepID=A0A8X6W2D7_TRICX|nr:hypothetical protein TNCV_931791 [Trichonephila clavipes]